METTPRAEYLIECLIQVVGRVAVPEEKVREIVGWKPKQVRAFNFCDGNTSQKDIAKKVRLHQQSLSVSAKRWVQNGVAFWVGDGKNARLLHIYPLDEKAKPPKNK